MKLPPRATGMVRHALVFEYNIYKSLVRWAFRRPGVPSGFEPVGYARLVTPMLWLWVFGSALELPLVHALIPWQGVRTALLIVGVWGLLWMVGVLAGLHSYPHLLGPDALRIRNGAMHDIAIPWKAISRVTTDDRSLPSSLWVLQPQETDQGVQLNVAVSGRVNVHLALRDVLAVRTTKGEMVISGVSFWVDEPREVSARIREEARTRVRRGR